MKIPIRKLFRGRDYEREPGQYNEFQADIVAFRMRQESESVREIMEQCRAENREPTNGECAELSEILEEMCSLESCEDWFDRREDEEEEWGTLDRPFKQPLAPYVWEENWSLEKNVRKLSFYRMAVFLDYLRSGEWDWRWPNLSDMRQVEKLGENFLNLDERKKVDFIRHLVNPNCEKSDIAIVKKKLALDQRAILKSTDGLRGKARARALADKGFTGFGDLGAMEAYKHNSGGFSSQISKWLDEEL